MNRFRHPRPLAFVAVTGLVLALALIMSLPVPVFAEDELIGQYYTVQDEAGKVILETGMKVNIGDVFIDGDNNRYEVFEVIGLRAKARVVGREPVEAFEDETPPANSRARLWETVKGWGRAVAAQTTGGGKPLVAMYHTHSDESYIPTDGASNKEGRGGIYAVGASLAMGLKQAGADVIQDPAVFSPHDSGAYDRSRRTAVQLLKRRPTMLLDVHRDAAPRSAYETNVANTLVTKVMIVVGRANPTESANLGVAKGLKAALDSKFPGLVKGIFMAVGKYNQDLYPRALLLEFGGENNPRSEAEAAAKFVGQTIPGFLKGHPTSGSVGGSTAGQNSGFLTALAWILGVTLVGAAGFLFINSGNWPEARKKLRQMWSTEMASFFGRLRWARRGRENREALGPEPRTFRKRKRNRQPNRP